MGSEVSSSNKSLEMEQTFQSPQDRKDVQSQSRTRKPTRSQFDAEKFYCPFIYDDSNMNFLNEEPLPNIKTPILYSKSEVIIEDSGPLEEQIVADVGVQIELLESKSTQVTVEDMEICANGNGDLDQQIDDKIEQAIDASTTEELASKPNLAIFHLEPINVQSNEGSNGIEIQSVDGKDICTNTSQPIYVDTAAGNSQPDAVMVDCATGMSQEAKLVTLDCATGMSQEAKLITMDCATQTSQEMLFSDLPFPLAIQSEGPTSKEMDKSQKTVPATTSKEPIPIILPRVRCQTQPPAIPAKIPRLNELDQNITVNPIYSSSVTFDFDDCDKENDSSVLRQRDSVGSRMKNEYKLFDKENLPNNGTFIQPSNVLFTSRAPFLRVGLSKKSRTRSPLHPRI